jgi:uncharacterized protein YecE (DUF72 family)
VKDKLTLNDLHIGTSGWSYQHWSGIFYPAHIKPDKYLEYYITKFGCVELNSSFYHLPLKATVAGWIRRTPEPFRFCPKLSRYITHQLKLVNIEEPMKNYFDVFEAMKNRLGPVLIQLPPGLQFDKFLTGDFFYLIKELYKPYRFAIEIRHKSWINDNFFDLLVQNGIAFTIADSGKRYPYHEAATADLIYLRFHGHEKLYASDYSESELQYYAAKTVGWLNEGKEVWAFFNNDYNGFAVKNAARMRELVLSATHGS